MIKNNSQTQSNMPLRPLPDRYARRQLSVGDNPMIEKVYITSKQMATFSCPKFQKSKTVNVSQYANIDKIVKKVIERNIMKDEIGTGLAPTEAVDKALRFYLLS